MPTNKLIRYDIVINTDDNGVEDDLVVFLQKCIWARKPKDQNTFTYAPYGISGEYTIYSCNLSEEDLLCLKLKFNGLAYATRTVIGRCEPDDIFEAAMGEPYLHSYKVRKARRDKLMSSMQWLKS
jgi:hypothetical protein